MRLKTISLTLVLTALPVAAMAQGSLPAARTNPSPYDPTIGAPAAPASMGNPAARETSTMPVETGNGTVPGSGADASNGGKPDKK